MLRRTLDIGDLETTEDDFLDGALRLLQPKVGYRAGMDALLLGAAIPAVAGQHVLDLGCGVGTAGLCLARRVPDVRVTGIELQQEIYTLAMMNAERNGLSDRVNFVKGDLRGKGKLLAARSFDHVIGNPPYIASQKGQSSTSTRADLSKRESEADLADWIDSMLYWVTERGYITVVHRADRLHEIIDLLTPRVGGLRVCPIWPKRGRNANRVLVQGRREAKTGLTLSPGIFVRHHDDTVTSEMEGITRYGHGLVF